MKNLMMSLSLALVSTTAFSAPAETLEVTTVEIREFTHERALKNGGINGNVQGGVPTKPGSGTPTTNPYPGAQGGFTGIDIAGLGGGGDISGTIGTIGGGTIGGIGGIGGGYGFPTDPLAQASQVVTIARDVVALGEAIYTLVQRGKPSSTTEYAPIALVPKDPISKEPLDPYELGTCSIPVEKKYATSMKTGGKEVVKFEYMIVFVYNCSYNGLGKFIQAALIQPVTVKAGYGWDFTATMKVSGVMNHGTKADPVVGAMLTMKYSMNSWRTAFEKNDTIHITGRGEIKHLTRP